MKSDHLANEADRLKNDPIFIRALADIRSEALEELAVAPADSMIDIAALQQRVAVIDEIRATLDRYILAVEPADESPGSYA